MKNALIGFTGFVGQNLNPNRFTDFINSKNIDDYNGRFFDLLVIAAGDARKWYANQNSSLDMLHILALFEKIKSIKAKKVIVISTVDVYNDCYLEKSCNEDKDVFNDSPYGLHRLMLEKLISINYNDTSVIRLPGLFGKGLKKNIIFDACSQRYDQLVNYNLNSKYQYFDLRHLDSFIDIVIEKKYPLINIATEPISVREIVNVLNIPEELISGKNSPVSYNVTTKYVNSGYFFNKEQVLTAIKKFYEDVE
jgi:nucleoside-diphosphate-sugar epimerase